MRSPNANQRSVCAGERTSPAVSETSLQAGANDMEGARTQWQFYLRAWTS